MEELQEKHYYVIILCGGSGKRLWPRSRNQKPKQFINLFGKRTIFQETVARAKRFVPFSKIFVVTNQDYWDEVRQQAPGIPRENIIAEPLGKNTALAMGLGALYIHQRDPLAVIANFASDHRVSDLEKFDQSIKTAFETADSGDYLVTVGIKPTFPHTGMGYIKTSHIFQKYSDGTATNVDKFIEKPDVKTAERFLSDGGYYWNANLYTWRADSILRSIQKHMPKLGDDLERIRESIGKKEEEKIILDIYEKTENISIDVGVSEKADNMLLIPSDFSWSDVGDWKTAYDISPKDKDNNVLLFQKGDGEFIGKDTRNCLIHFSDQLVATIGVEDLIIVDTKDVLLVAKKSRSQEVKDLVNLLEKKGDTKYL